MYVIKIGTNGHIWRKINNKRKKSRDGSTHDILRCSCGLVGKSWGPARVQLNTRFNQDQVFECPIAKQKAKTMTNVRVTKLNAMGPNFSNLKRNTVHEVIPAPNNNETTGGVWVMGAEEPTKLLYGEFAEVEEGESVTMVRSKGPQRTKRPKPKPEPVMIRTRKPKFKRTRRS